MRRRIIAALVLVMLAFGMAASAEIAVYVGNEIPGRVQKRIEAVDSAAKGNKNLIVYRPEGADGAYVFVRTKFNSDTSTTGRFWYITKDKAALLGACRRSWSWGLLDVDPQVFYNSYGEGRQRRVAACVLVDGKPVRVSGTEKLLSLDSNHGALMGMAAWQDYDYAFLRVKIEDGKARLFQVRATEISEKLFSKLNGAKAILANAKKEGFKVRQILYWKDSAIALNLEKDGKKAHLYVYREGGKVVPEGGWEEDYFDALDGYATATRNLDLPVEG